MKYAKDAGQERCCTLYRREQDRRDAGQKRDWTGEMLYTVQERARHEGGRTGRMQVIVGEDECWTGGIQDRRDAVQEGLL